MKFVSFAALPFHRWCLAPVVEAARRAGHEVVEVGHEPGHHHDWWTGSAATKELIRNVSLGADYLLAADYPFEPLRPLLPSLTDIVSLRHSLASRGNTYEPEQFAADHIAAFSEFDVGRLASAWGRLPKRRPIQFATAGCPWAAPVLSPDRAGARSALLDRVGLQHDDPRPVVAVATTWNPWTSLDAVRELAADRDRIVIWRPHWAAAWRRPGELDEVRSFGAFVDDPLEHPSTLLLGSDVLVGDVSGIVLLATLVRGATPFPEGLPTAPGALPVVMIDPDPSALLDSGQLDATGPEWEFRDRIGPRLPARRVPGAVAATVSAVLARDESRTSRVYVGETMAGTYTTPTSADRLIEALTR